MRKVIVLLLAMFFCQNLVDVQKHCKKVVQRIKSKNSKKKNTHTHTHTRAFWGVIIWSKVVSFSGPSLVLKKLGQLGPDNNTWNMYAHLYIYIHIYICVCVLKPLFYCAFLTSSVSSILKQANLHQLLAPQKAKLGPDNNSTAIYYWGQNHYMPKKLFWAISFWITSHYRTSVFVCPD